MASRAAPSRPVGWWFSIAGGYSTTDGALAELSVTESNFLGRGQFVRAAVSKGQNSQGFELSFTEPYFLDRRLAAGFDIFRKETNQSSFSQYQTILTGGTIRFGLPVTDELSFSPRYSLYQTQINIPNKASAPYNDCTFILPTTLGNCLSNGEASLAVKEAKGNRLTSLVGYTLAYNTLDNNKNPTAGIYGELKQDFAGLGGDSKFIRSTADVRYYRELFDDVVGFARLQGGNIWGYGSEKLRIGDNFNLGPSLVRGFAPGGIGPRDLNTLDNKQAGIGGTTYFGGTLEVQFPIFGLPRDLGLKGAVFADAGTLFGFNGKTNFTPGGGLCVVQVTTAGSQAQGTCLNVRDSHVIRSSVGASLLWASPLGPIRFDYAFALTKDSKDVKQGFRFSGGSSF